MITALDYMWCDVSSLRAVDMNERGIFESSFLRQFAVSSLVIGNEMVGME